VNVVVREEGGHLGEELVEEGEGGIECGVSWAI